MPSQPFIGEIYHAGFNFAPQGYALCNGAIMAISQNTALFSLLGTQFGGNGTSNFALPDLQGRVAVGSGQGAGLQNYNIGQVGGVESVSLLVQQIPSHAHLLQASTHPGNDRSPNANVLAVTKEPAYTPTTPNVDMGATSIAATGGGQAHENRQPFLVVVAYIALVGVFPSRS